MSFVRSRLARRTLTILFASAFGVLAVATPAHATPPNHFGAMAISFSTGSVGSAVNYYTTHEAQLAAMARCGVADCQWVVTMDRNCGSVAQQPLTDHWGWAYGPDRNRARVSARNAAGWFAYDVLSACTAR